MFNSRPQFSAFCSFVMLVVTEAVAAPSLASSAQRHPHAMSVRLRVTHENVIPRSATVASIAYSADNRHLIISYRQMTNRAGAPKERLHSLGRTTLAVVQPSTKDGTHGYFAVTGNATVAILDLKTGRIRRIHLGGPHRPEVSDIRIGVWNEKRSTSRTLVRSFWNPSAIGLSSTGRYLAVGAAKPELFSIKGGLPSTLNFIDSKDGRRVVPEVNDDRDIACVSFARMRLCVAYGGEDRKIMTGKAALISRGFVEVVHFEPMRDKGKSCFKKSTAGKVRLLAINDDARRVLVAVQRDEYRLEKSRMRRTTTWSLLGWNTKSGQRLVGESLKPGETIRMISIGKTGTLGALATKTHVRVFDIASGVTRGVSITDPHVKAIALLDDRMALLIVTSEGRVQEYRIAK